MSTAELYTCLNSAGCVKGIGHEGPCFGTNGERLTAFTQAEWVRALRQAMNYVELGYFPKVNGVTDFVAWQGVTLSALAELLGEVPRLVAASVALGDAAREIPCAGPVAHRIRVMRQEWSEALAAARNFTQADVLNLRAEAFTIRKRIRERVEHGPEYETQQWLDDLADRIEALVPGHLPGHSENDTEGGK